MFSLCHKSFAESLSARNMIVLEKVRFVHMIRKAGESQRLATKNGWENGVQEEKRRDNESQHQVEKVRLLKAIHCRVETRGEGYVVNV